MSPNRTARRPGFTLVELLVAFALILFIMAVIAQAFGAAGKVVSDLKVAGEMEEKLRAVMILLRRDLQAGHFDEDISPGRIKLSDGGSSDFWTRHYGTLAVPRSPSGFFRLYQVGRPAGVTSGTDIPTTVMPSPAAPTGGSSLHFSVFRPQDEPGKMFRTPGDPILLYPARALALGSTTLAAAECEERFQSISGTDFASPWGEVAWWLEPASQPSTTVSDEGLAGQPLYVLRRRERAMWPLPGTNPGDSALATEVSRPPLDAVGGATRYNDPARISIPAFRFGMAGVSAADINGGAAYAVGDPRLAGLPSYPSQPYPSFPAGHAALLAGGLQATPQDIVISGVLSFDVSVLLEGDTQFRDLGDPVVQASYTGSNPAFPAAAGPYCFDTWTNRDVGSFSYGGTRWSTAGTYASVPLYAKTAAAPAAFPATIRIRAIQVTLRIWNQKDGPNGKTAGSARQMTMIQEM